MLAVLATMASGQPPKTPSKTTKAAPTPAKTAPKTTTASASTLSGVYTKAQATRGRYVYIGSCVNCHSAATHTGATFAEWWKGKPLADLYSYVLERMPKNDPGSLAPEDAADVVAYLLQMNQMPVGKAEMYPDADSLRKFRIDLVQQRSGTSTAKGAQP
jgi:mono/diheme cytochrome c family protein